MAKKEKKPVQKALNFWAVILIVWAFYRSYFKMPIWFDEIIIKFLVFTLPVFYYIKKIEKKPIFESLYLFFRPKLIINDFFYASSLILILLITIFFGYYLRTGDFFSLENLLIPDSFLFFIFVSLVSAFHEEVISRGFILKRLYEDSKNLFSSTFFASVLFFFLHIPILFSDPRTTGSFLFLALITNVFLSIVNGLIFLWRQSLFSPIFIHSIYNLLIGIIKV
ncbi:MAG: CPBP family intramembrane metalloprotease [Patescibacteria group bacterium]|nr:CPBP family intramembrane metalloprotease [Patescibacteria group bacterium]